MSIAETLQAQGWSIGAEGVMLIQEQLEKQDATPEDIIAAAKDLDLRILGGKGFCKTDGGKLEQVPSPAVLQVLEIRNVAMPTIQSHSDHARLLRVTFTDGSKKKLIGAEVLGKVDSIKWNTPPGTKYLVTKPIAIRDQLLLLGPGMLKELGGRVDELIQAWRAGKQFIKRSSHKTGSGEKAEDNVNGPPLFVPFKVKVPSPPTSSLSSTPKKHASKSDKCQKKGSNDATKKKNATDAPTKGSKPVKPEHSTSTSDRPIPEKKSKAPKDKPTRSKRSDQPSTKTVETPSEAKVETEEPQGVSKDKEKRPTKKKHPSRPKQQPSQPQEQTQQPKTLKKSQQPPEQPHRPPQQKTDSPSQSTQAPSLEKQSKPKAPSRSSDTRQTHMGHPRGRGRGRGRGGHPPKVGDNAPQGQL